MKTWIANIKWKYNSAAETIKSRLKQLEFMWYEELHISNELRAYCRKHYKKDYYLYKGIPGIGGITASGILSELGDIRRFSRLDELAAIVGLVPGIYQSGDNRINLGLTKRSNHQLRSLLVALHRKPMLPVRYSSCQTWSGNFAQSFGNIFLKSLLSSGHSVPVVSICSLNG